MPKGTPKPKEEEVISGKPEDGQEYVEPSSEEDSVEEQPETENKTPEPSPENREDPLIAMQRTIDSLNARLDNLSRPQPVPKAAPEPEPEPNWEELMFSDPKEYHRRLRESIESSVKGELTNSYQKAESEKAFWNDFYRDNDDLTDDKDLVDSILRSNAAELYPMVVPAAAKRLAELTRQRIMKYTGNKLPSTTKKAVTEGSHPPSPVKKEPEPPKVITLSDLIKARRAKRTKGTAA